MKSQTTHIRQAIEERFEEPGLKVKALLGPADFNGAFGGEQEDLIILLRLLVEIGPRDVTDKEGSGVDEAEERIDDLTEQVPLIVAQDRTLDGLVTDLAIVKCSGHRAYPDGVGVEWTLKVVK